MKAIIGFVLLKKEVLVHRIQSKQFSRWLAISLYRKRCKSRMSIVLFKATLQKNWLPFMIFLGILVMYSTAMITIYNPNDMASLMSMFELLPPDAMKALGFGGAVLVSEAMFKGAMDIGAFFRLNFTVMFVNMTVMSICFFFSCLFNDTKWSLGLGAGIHVLFLLCNMLGGV